MKEAVGTLKTFAVWLRVGHEKVYRKRTTFFWLAFLTDQTREKPAWDLGFLMYSHPKKKNPLVTHCTGGDFLLLKGKRRSFNRRLYMWLPSLTTDLGLFWKTKHLPNIHIRFWKKGHKQVTERKLVSILTNLPVYLPLRCTLTGLGSFQLPASQHWTFLQLPWTGGRRDRQTPVRLISGTAFSPLSDQEAWQFCVWPSDFVQQHTDRIRYWLDYHHDMCYFVEWPCMLPLILLAASPFTR